MMTGSHDISAFLLRLGLGFLWLWEGVTKLRFPSYELESIVMGTRLIPTFVNIKPWVPLLGVIEAVLGVCLLLGFRTRIVAGIQSVLLSGFTLFLLIGYPDLMHHPLGPLAKNFAILGAQLALWVSGGGPILSMDARLATLKEEKKPAARSGSFLHDD